MKCPSCADITLALSSRASIAIDYCPQCRGVWLDRGELDKIIERTDNSGGPRPAMRPAPAEARREDRDDRSDDDGDDHRSVNAGIDKKRKRKGFLSEMFEFGE